jgi:exonuclease SbcC
LEALLAHSNQHLEDFAKRYCLQRVPGSDLELQIIDRDMADDVRSVHSLSGGESFLVSLALALGLASLSSNKTQIESLFIDEGFGSLDPETLDIAIASLDTLQALGRKVGVISHVPILVERIGAKVVVEKLGGGRSRVVIVGGIKPFQGTLAYPLWLNGQFNVKIASFTHCLKIFLTNKCLIFHNMDTAPT